jgi:DNA-binding response OmpR family regulator
MARRVLVVDDEPQIRSVLVAYLKQEGYDVVEAATGADAIRMTIEVRPRPDLVLLDIGLPGIDGLDVLRQVRKSSDVYVILITARADEVDMVIGLGVGADDYITKPFSPRQVMARVKAVLRRIRDEAPEPADRVLRFPGVTIDEERREVTVAGRNIALSALEFDLLLALAHAPGRVYSRTQLLEQVWGYDFFGDPRVVDVHIRGMRKALGDDATDPTVIGTVRGVGYKFLLDPEPRP